MTENVQCPVCTLYLHAGMNLSDHLETHPKEQVIRALVQMTISGNGGTSALASVLAGDNSNTGSGSKKSNNNNELDEKPLPNNKQDNELNNIGGAGNSCSASSSNSTSNGSVTNQSISSSSQNSNNVLNFSANKNERNNETERDKTIATSSSSTTTLTAKSVVKTETTKTTMVMTKDNAMTGNANENINPCFSNQQNNNTSNSTTTNSSNSYHANAVELTNTSQIHNNFNMFSGTSRYDHQHQQQQHLRDGVNNQNQQTTPPHMPPPPAPASVLAQSQHAGQHTEVGRPIIPASSASATFHSLPPQQLPPPPPPHHTSSHLAAAASNSHRSAHMFATGQHQASQSNSQHHHQQQSLKVIYTPNLPPPPPLQLFTYQAQTHLQHHHKPPPAYGTAISQIRSQHNQNKHQVTGSLATPTQHQNHAHTILHQQQQHHLQQQQQTLQHSIRIQVPPPPPPIPIPIKHTFSSKNTNNLSIQQHQSTATTPSTSRHSHQTQQQHQQISKTELNHHQQQQSQNNADNTQNSNSTQIVNSHDITSKSTKGGITISTIGPIHNSNNVTSSYPQVSISPSVASASMAAVAASTLGRHTNSPFAALLAAAAGAPSPSTASSSVLRYAESPVAHYLERENGDFIVQETPKHIVECVETDNGEFSVIERIYQSPPSVLHIHDDDEDDEEDNANDHNKREGQIDKEQQDNVENKSKQNETLSDKIKEQTIGEKQRHKKDNKTPTEVNKSNKKSKINDESNSDNDDIVDFVSISSDSGDEEEFIAQEQKQHKNTTDKNKINQICNNSSSPTANSNTTTCVTPASASGVTNEQPSTSSSTPSSLSTSSANNNQSQQNSSAPSTSNSGNRKKSSKNTITVLSDVQLNLNEYLDLVGNIIASSKVAAAQRKTFAAIAPIPLVKIEKEEPMDEYTTVNSTKNNFETPLPPPPPITPLKANKHETDEITDNPSSSNNSNNNINNSRQTINNPNVILTNDLERDDDDDEQEEKKPQVFDNETTATSNAISNTTSSQMTINSSHVTSVIRMATTSQPQQHQLNPQSQATHQQLNPSSTSEANKNSNQAEDLSQNQRKIQPLQTPLARKGPKKLVIKPKSSKTDNFPNSSSGSSTKSANKPNENQLTNNQQEMPTTSCKAIQELTKKSSLTEDDATEVKVKNEPITSITYENQQQQLLHHNHYQPTANSFSILEQHLNSKEPILEFKEEKPCIQETTVSIPPTSIIKEMKVENNVNDDARVLYDFANSKKSQNETATSTAANTFPSSNSLFSSKKTSLENSSTVDHQQQPQQLTKNGNHIDDDNSSSSSNYSSQSAMDASIPHEDHNENSTPANDQIIQQQHQSNHMYSDFHFNYLYNNNGGGNNVTQVAAVTNDIKNPSEFTTFYQNPNNTLILEDSSSSKHYTDFQQHNNQQLHHQQLQHQQAAGTSHHQWFSNSNSNNYQTPSEPNITPLTSNHSISNMNSAGGVLSVDGSSATALDGTEVSKYLDLDSCKREQNIELIVGDRVPPPSSSTSCSFNGATDNSMAGICSTSAATLNIRTDEKMPAKGEISEQESNCDIDNSWSQPMYGDISARFFKTTFPGIFPQDNGWNHDEYFTVQDLSASTTAQATTSNSSRLKSFEPLTSSSSNNNNISTSMPMFSQNSNDNCNIDVMPSTSAKIRKRRKRSSQDDKVSQANNKRMQPTSTVTSQQMMMQHQNELTGIEFNFQQLPQQQQLQEPSTSSAFLAGPSNANSGFILQQQQQLLHPQQQPPQSQQIQQKQRTKVYECGHCNAKYSKLKDRNAHMVDVHNYIRQNRRLICPTTGLATPLTSTDMQNDAALPTTSAASGSMLMSRQLQNPECMGDYKQGIVKIENENLQRDLAGIEPINANLSAKTEFMEDDKQNLALVPLNGTTNPDCDTKPTANNLPLSLTTPTSKLTTLYRMLVTFNMTTLKQNQNLSEIDENLIKSSIFFCYICRQNFNSVKFYDAHLTEHPAECFTCGKKFQRWKNFSLHLKRHLGWKEFGCTVCEKKFVVRSALVEHTRMHSGLSPLKCKVCGKHFKRYSNLTQHRKRHTKKNVRRKEYVCYCGEVLPSKARFLWHKETHDSKPKCCPHCCDRFVHVNSLRRHIRLAHSDKFDYTEPMECPICKQIFAKASMKAHVATHSTETQYDCTICNKSFSTKWNLKIHSWVHANRTAKPFKCEHCPKAFVREVDFKNHMNSHKQIKPYTCEVCGCKFIRKYNYMRHRREHHGNKKYTCDLCKKSFHRHYYLIEHRRIHTGERPFQCTICGKSSTTKTNHNKHLKIHHSRDPFTVEV